MRVARPEKFAKLDRECAVLDEAARLLNSGKNWHLYLSDRLDRSYIDHVSKPSWKHYRRLMRWKLLRWLRGW